MGPRRLRRAGNYMRNIILPQWRRAEMGPRRGSAGSDWRTVSESRNGGGPRWALGGGRAKSPGQSSIAPQWRRAEMGPRREQPPVAVCGGSVAAMEEGRDGPSEAAAGSSWWGHNAAAMEEGRDGPSEVRISTGTHRRNSGRNGGGPRWALGGPDNPTTGQRQPPGRNGGGPRWALGGTSMIVADPRLDVPQWRRAEMGPRRGRITPDRNRGE